MAIAATLICAASFAQSGKSIYNKYSDKSNVTAVYISPAMFKMMGQLPEIDTPDGDFNIAPVVKEMSGMYMIESGNPSINNALKADVEKYISALSASVAYGTTAPAKDFKQQAAEWDNYVKQVKMLETTANSNSFTF